MIIRSLTASFGKFRGDTLDLQPGLNVIAAPNESGKSTWCAFLQAMLYGVDSSAREKGGVLPAKVRYAPWSGAPMEGRMELDWNGNAVTITRKTAQKSAPMRDFSAVYTGTGLPVPGLTGPSAGEQLTGVSRDVFQRTAFIGQGEIPVSASPELEKRINALVFSGEEDLSASAAMDTLRVWLRKRRKAMEQIESEQNMLRTAAGSGDALRRERETVARQLELAEQTVAQLQQESTQLRREQRQAALQRMSSNKSRLQALQSAVKTAEEDERTAAELLSRSPFSGSHPEDARRRAETDLTGARRLEREGRATLPWPVWVTAALAVISLVLGIVWQPTAGFGAFFCTVLTVVLAIQSRKHAAQARQKLANLLAFYGVHSASELETLADAYEEQYRVWQDAEQRLTTSRAELEEEYTRRSGRDAEILRSLDFETGVNAAASAGRRLKQAEQLAADYRTRLAKLDGRLETDGALRGEEYRIRDLEVEKKRLETQYDAILLAMHTLESADREIQRVFSPQLSRRASEIMSFFTDGRYDALALDRDLTAQARLSGDLTGHRAGYLSTGTADLLYLAVRLALCELILPEGACPLILDDSLSNLDPVRKGRVMEYLSRTAEHRQVILFSCTEVS